MRPLIAGNWKMHGLKADLHEIESIAALAARTQAACRYSDLSARLLARRRGADSGGPDRHRRAGLLTPKCPALTPATSARKC